MGLKDLGKQLRISQRPLGVFYLIDTSASMEGEKIAAVNRAMHELEIALRAEAHKNPSAQVLVRTVVFGGEGAFWQQAEGVPVEKFSFRDIAQVSGTTPMGGAISLLCGALQSSVMPHRSLRPVAVLLSDGRPSDDYRTALDDLLSLPWGKRAVRAAVAIGKDADRKVLSEFASDPALVLRAGDPSDLVRCIRWTSTLVSGSSGHTMSAGKLFFAPDTVLTDDGDFD